MSWIGLASLGHSASGKPSQSRVTAAGSDLEMLIDENSLEMLEELEFYAWLELDEVDGAGHSG